MAAIFWPGRKVAITGATGFVGFHVARQLQSLGADILALVRASSNIQSLLATGIPYLPVCLEDEVGLGNVLAGCDLVFHVAGAVGFTNDWQPYLDGNVNTTWHVLQAARRAGVRRVIYTSSIVAVGAALEPTLLDETSPWNLGSLRIPYVTTKRWAEKLALAENGRDLEVIVVNPASVIGPDDYSGSEFGILCQRFWSGKIPFHFGGGSNFVDVRDVAWGHCLAAEWARPGQRYLLAGHNRSYRQFFWNLCQAAGRSIPRLCLPAGLAPLVGRIHDRFPRRKDRRPYLSAAQAAIMGLFFYFDNAKARRELGYQPRSLRQSLSDAHRFWMGPAARKAA